MYRKDFVQPHSVLDELIGSVTDNNDWVPDTFLRFLLVKQQKCIFQYDNDWKHARTGSYIWSQAVQMNCLNCGENWVEKTVPAVKLSSRS